MYFLIWALIWVLQGLRGEMAVWSISPVSWVNVNEMTTTFSSTIACIFPPRLPNDSGGTGLPSDMPSIMWSIMCTLALSILHWSFPEPHFSTTRTSLVLPCTPPAINAAYDCITTSASEPNLIQSSDVDKSFSLLVFLLVQPYCATDSFPSSSSTPLPCRSPRSLLRGSGSETDSG